MNEKASAFMTGAFLFDFLNPIEFLHKIVIFCVNLS